MSVFIINDSYTMPLHDHPSMKGILKVISGKLKIQSFTRLSETGDGAIFVKQEDPKVLDQHSPSSVLDERVGNYHEITAIGGVAAFFDVLSPPYSEASDLSQDSRHCSFYRKILVDNGKVIRLEHIDCPRHYYCDTLHFEKPDYMKQELT